MTYSYLTIDELVMIEAYYHPHISVTIISNYLKQSGIPINNIANFLNDGHSALGYYTRYKKNKQRYGRN